MRILLDECVDARLTREIVGHDVTVPQMGWAGTPDGPLLGLAEGKFDAFVTIATSRFSRISPSSTWPSSFSKPEPTDSLT